MYQKLRVAVLSLFLAITSFAFASDIDLKTVQEAIQASGANWVAGETWLTRLAPEQRQFTHGLRRERAARLPGKLYKIPPMQDLPPAFSWADNNGNFITKVKNQGQCGSCSYFATMGAVEAFMRIKTGNPKLDIDLSEQYVLSCGSVGNCENGAYISGVLRYVRDHGVPSEACFPYQQDDNVPCSNACPDWQSQIVKIGDFIVYYDHELDVEEIKNLVYHRPVIVDMEIYNDFDYYVGGVYEHVTGDDEGGHAVVIYGWDDSQEAWLCKNSWGEGWGEKGLFRIKWGEADIASTVCYIWDEAQGFPRMVVTPQSIQLSLAPGENVTRYIHIRNEGTGQLEFSSDLTGDTMTNAYFHSSTLNAYDGQSWWCGSEKLSGYDNHWLQYLETPVLNLQGTQNPVLTFNAFWSIDADSCHEPGYDGYDGANIWISTDGGASYRVAAPALLPYNCQSLYSFGGEFHLGYNIPGWNGQSRGWQEIRVDLSQFKSPRLRIRFAFASDGSGCSRDKDVSGFFVDNIRVRDGNTILFKDSAELNSPMQVISSTEADLSWLHIPYASGTLLAGESLTVPLQIAAAPTASGFYMAYLNIANNHNKAVPVSLPISVNVEKSPGDIGLGDCLWPSSRVPRYMNIRPVITLKNWGQRDQTNVAVSCRLLTEDGQVRQQRIEKCDSLTSGHIASLQYPATALADTGDYQFDFRLLNASFMEQDNPSNNETESWFHVSPLIDDFEKDSGLWNTGDGWGRMRNFTGGYKSPYAMHVNHGEHYENNMDNRLTFKASFDLSALSSATLRYWVRHAMEPRKDYLLVQLSNDGVSWVTVDSLSGYNLRWHERTVWLGDFVGPGHEAVRLRFRFRSNDSRTGIGPLLDNIRIVSENPAGAQLAAAKSFPHNFELQPNYPNPFNPTTTIAFFLPEPSRVRVSIYNITGQLVATLVDERLSRGHHRVEWNAQNYPSGVYLLHVNVLQSSAQRLSRSMKMLLIK